MFEQIRNSKFVKFGIPFFTIVFGGALGLTEFSKVRYEHRQQTALTKEELQALGITKKSPHEVTIEKEYDRIKDMDIDTWENIRGPRPWEEETMQQQPSKKKL